MATLADLTVSSAFVAVFVVVDRSPNDHTSFGFGSHFCLGANLARMEIRVTLERLLKRLPDLQIAPDRKAQRFPSSIVNGLSSLPVIFGARSGE